MASKTELITQAEYAKRRGVSPAAVNKAVQTGRIKLIDGKIDPEVADIQWMRNTNPSQRRSDPSLFTAASVIAVPATGDAGQAPTGEVYNIAAARARKEHFDAHITEMKALRDSGGTIDVSSVSNSVTRVFAQFREAMESMPDKLAERLAAENDPAVVFDLLSSELESALHAASAGLENCMAR